MRRLALKFLILLALVWGGWWYLATNSAVTRVNAWLAELQAEGWQATADTVEAAGFPLRTTVVIDQLALQDPATQTAMQVPQMTLSAPIYWPGHATVNLPADPITFASPQGKLSLASDGTQAALRLHPGVSLQLESLSSSSSNVTLNSDVDQILSIKALQADVKQGRAPETYAIDLIATGLALSTAFFEGATLPSPWPDTFEPIVADVAVTFDRPWDRSALQRPRPQPREIRITEVSASYADTSITLGGDLTVDAQGIPTGALRIRMQNWQGLFEIMVATTEIPPEWAPTVAQMLQSMSDQDGTLDLTLTAQNGQLRIGFLPLGPAPRLVIR